MDTPGLNHILLTVSDVEQSRRFYGDLLGFEMQTFMSRAGNVFYYFVTGGVSIWLRLHADTPAGDRFDERRIGLDHLAFTAPNKAALHALADKLIAAGVPTNGVEIFYDKWPYVAFRDPDNIQLEYWLDEPAEE